MLKSTVKGSGRLFIIALMITCITFCSSSGETGPQKKRIEDHIKKFIPVSTLESVGFEHISASDFLILMGKKFFYVLNIKDLMVVKFQGTSPKKIYKASKGQGPREMLVPRSIFFYNPVTIAIQDCVKNTILFFDLDLNYIRETKISDTFYKISATKSGLVTFLFCPEDKVTAFLNKDFKIVDTFVDANKKLPFSRFFQHYLNHGYLLNRELIGHSHRTQPYKDCKVDIYDLASKKLKVSLCWQQTNPQSRKDFKEWKNYYFTSFVQKAGKFYLIQTCFLKHVASPARFELLIFNEKGNLIYKDKFPYQYIDVCKLKDDRKFYFMDKVENISYIDVRDII